MIGDSVEVRNKEVLRKDMKKFKYEVWWKSQGTYGEDELIEEFGSLKKAVKEAKEQADLEPGEIFYVLKVREVFKVGG